MSASQLTKTWDEFSDIDEQAMEESSAIYNTNDDGRAQQFIDHNLDNIRFVPAWDTWLIWSGHHWKRDTSDLIRWKVVELSRKLVDEANRANNPDTRAAAMILDAFFSMIFIPISRRHKLSLQVLRVCCELFVSYTIRGIKSRFS